MSATRTLEHRSHLDLMVTLVVNVVEHLLSFQSNSGDEVAARPEGAGWKLLRFLFEPHGALSFQDLHDIRR